MALDFNSNRGILVIPQFRSIVPIIRHEALYLTIFGLEYQHWFTADYGNVVVTTKPPGEFESNEDATATGMWMLGSIESAGEDLRLPHFGPSTIHLNGFMDSKPLSGDLSVSDFDYIASSIKWVDALSASQEEMLQEEILSERHFRENFRRS